MISETNIFVIAATIVILSFIVSISIFNLNDRNLMSKNIESAISKGIDPMAVRCSYASERDFVCIAYAASSGHQQPTPPTKK